MTKLVKGSLRHVWFWFDLMYGFGLIWFDLKKIIAIFFVFLKFFFYFLIFQIFL